MAHLHLDDLESFFYALFQVLTCWNGPGLERGDPMAFCQRTIKSWGESVDASLYSKEMLFFQDLSVHTVPPFWSTASRTLLWSFWRFIGNITHYRRRCVNGNMQHERLVGLKHLHDQRDQHYLEILQFFDKALQTLDVPQGCPLVSGGPSIICGVPAPQAL